MIYAELNNLLVSLASTETVAAFDEAVQLFDKYQVTEYMEIFEKSIESTSELGDAAVLDALLINCKSILNYLLSMQGITLHDEVLPSERNTIVDAMAEIVYYEDKNALSAILDSDDTTVEKFGSLMELITPYCADQIMTWVDEIDESFVVNFQQILNQQPEDTVGHAESVKAQIAAYTQFKQFLNNVPLYADKYFAQLGSIGIDFKFYVQWYQSDHPDLSLATPETIAKDLIGLAFLSEDACANPLMAIRQQLATIFTDVTFSTKVDIAVTKVTLALGASK